MMNIISIKNRLRRKAAKEFNTNKSIQSCKKLLNILEEEKANLICQYEAFSLFVKECEEKKLTSTPLYKWTKDTIENEAQRKLNT